MNSIEIYPSLLAADFSNLTQEIITVEMAGANGLHFDVMDGHYVPNISFGAVVLNSIRPVTKLPFWVHLMISEPRKYFQDFINAGANGLFLHPETDQNICELAYSIREQGVKPGMAINPDTDLDHIKEYVSCFQDFLIMTVYPGFGGQELITNALENIRKIINLTEELNMQIQIHVDGGVNKDTVPSIIKSGANVLVAGSSIFQEPDAGKALQNLRAIAVQNI